MRVATTRWGARVAAPTAAVVLALAALTGLAPAAHAAGPNVTPFVNCYWDNGDNTYTVSLGADNAAKTTVTVPVGTDNRVSPGTQDRGQPTSFAPGTANNVWVVTITAPEVTAGINWYLTGHTVSLRSVQACASKPIPQDGNPLAVVVFGALTSLIGAAFLGERRRRHRARSIA
jgi:hypothetical protein